MARVDRGARFLHAQRFRPDLPARESWDDILKREVGDDPAYQEITAAALRAAGLGFDTRDPDVFEKVLRAGRAEYAEKVAGGMAPRQVIVWPAVTDDSHAPIVYYMRLADLVKIGTTVNIRQRRATINPEGILAVEFGDSRLEHQRHREFADCHQHGEWFRFSPELAALIVTVRAAFETETGATVEAWLADRLGPRQQARRES